MSRSIGFAGLLLLMIINPSVSLTAAEWDGLVLPPTTQRSALLENDSTADAPWLNRIRADGREAKAALADKWDCETREGQVRIRRITLCRVVSQYQILSEPAERSGMIRYRVLVEKGLEQRGPKFAARVDKILGAGTGWARNGVRFVRAADKHDITVLLASPESVDRLCRPLRTRGWLSCAMGRNAIINAKRWHEGAETWGDDVRGYHHYLINHEVGHVLGLRHLDCPQEGLPAPIMLQQTIFLKGCIANGSATPGDIAMLTRIMPRIKRRFDGLEPKEVRRPRIKRKRLRNRARVSRRSVRRRGRSRRR